MKRVPPPLTFAFLLATSVVIWWHPLITTLNLAASDEQYTHIFLIIPVSAALIFVEWRQQNAAPAQNGLFGAGLFLLAFLIGWSGWFGARRISPDVQMSLSMAALVTSWIAAFVLCFGPTAARLLIFPLGFLYWLVPVPPVILNSIVGGLQRSSAWTARELFVLARVPVTQDGVLLYIPRLTIEVAQECSSIRSTLMLVVTSMVLAHLFLRSTSRKILMVIVAIPLSIARNGFRIFALAMLGTHVDRGFLFGSLHHKGGIVFFALALAAILFLLRLLRWNEDRQNLQPASDPSRSGP